MSAQSLDTFVDHRHRGAQVFEGVVRDLLVNNGHRATVESIPNLALEAEIDDKERGKLDQIKQSMSDEVQLHRRRDTVAARFISRNDEYTRIFFPSATHYLLMR